MEIKTRNEETTTPRYSKLFVQWEHDLIYQNGFWFSPQGSKYQACDSEKACSPGDTRSLSTQAVTGHAQPLRQAGPRLAAFPLLSPFPRPTHQLGLPRNRSSICPSTSHLSPHQDLVLTPQCLFLCGSGITTKLYLVCTPLPSHSRSVKPLNLRVFHRDNLKQCHHDIASKSFKG